MRQLVLGILAACLLTPLLACKPRIPEERRRAQTTLVETVCSTCLKTANGCDAEQCRTKAFHDFGETPVGWGNAKEGDVKTWRENEERIQRCFSEITDARYRWSQQEEKKRASYQPYDKRVDTGCK